MPDIHFLAHRLLIITTKIEVCEFGSPLLFGNHVIAMGLIALIVPVQLVSLLPSRSSGVHLRRLTRVLETVLFRLNVGRSSILLEIIELLRVFSQVRSLFGHVVLISMPVLMKKRLDGHVGLASRNLAPIIAVHRRTSGDRVIERLIDGKRVGPLIIDTALTRLTGKRFHCGWFATIASSQGILQVLQSAKSLARG